MRFGRLVLRIGDDCSLRRRTNASFVQCSANFITCTGAAQSASSSTSKSASSSYVSSFDKRPAAHSRGQSAVPPIHEARALPCSAPQCEWLGSGRTVKHAAAAAILLWRGWFLRRSVARLLALLRRLVPAHTPGLSHKIDIEPTQPTQKRDRHIACGNVAWRTAWARASPHRPQPGASAAPPAGAAAAGRGGCHRAERAAGCPRDALAGSCPLRRPSNPACQMEESEPQSGGRGEQDPQTEPGPANGTEQSLNQG